ncbi:MAG: DUF2382 domain-containing protein, partial [Candidatus Sericytochromatia bacterium]|nr:DUF2382 domain-containing protein [Candidatus Sericytochromatia bacterium]
ILDLLADERLRRVVYAVVEVDDSPPVLLDIERVTLDAKHRQAKVALSLAGLMLLSPALWWRRPPALRQAAMQPVGETQSERIVVPVYGEQLVIEKRPVVIEEIVITKRPEVRHEMVRQTVRRERAEVIPLVEFPTAERPEPEPPLRPGQEPPDRRAA